jgi:hypothetical protein
MTYSACSVADIQQTGIEIIETRQSIRPKGRMGRRGEIDAQGNFNGNGGPDDRRATGAGSTVFGSALAVGDRLHAGVYRLQSEDSGTLD